MTLDLSEAFQPRFDASGCGEVPFLVKTGNHELDPDERTGEASSFRLKS